MQAAISFVSQLRTLPFDVKVMHCVRGLAAFFGLKH